MKYWFLSVILALMSIGMIIYYRFYSVQHAPNGDMVDPFSGGVGEMILLYALAAAAFGVFSIWKQADKKGWIGLVGFAIAVIVYALV